MTLVIVLTDEEYDTFTQEQAVEAYMERAHFPRAEAEIQARLALGFYRGEFLDEDGNPLFYID